MNPVLDAFIVGTLACIAACYALFALGPKSWRARVLSSLAHALEHGPRPLGFALLAARVKAAAARRQAACGGCEGCAPAAPTDSGEIKIPVAKIGRRS